jgi:acyl-CoA thioesterase FadM
MKPIKVDDELRIDAAVTVLKKSSFEMSYKFYRNENQLVASAKVVHVCIQKEKFEKCELPEEFYQKLKANLA